MGNRKLRKEVAKAIREYPYPLGCRKLYVGRKFAAFRWGLHAWRLRELLKLLSFKPGDLINDCDGFNHRVVKPLPSYAGGKYGGKGGEFTLSQFEMENGCYSCHAVPPWTVERIVKYHREVWTQDEIDKYKSGGWEFTGHLQKLRDILDRGEPICDSDGLPLFKEEY